MKTPRLGKQVAALAMVIPLLAGCQKALADASLRGDSPVQDEARQQAIQEQMEAAQRTAAAQQMSQRVPQMGMPH